MSPRKSNLAGRFAVVVAVLSVFLLAGPPVAAQNVPDPTIQEILIKRTLMTFNDANLTGNYVVLHARLSKPFRDQFPPQRLAEVFKGFRDQNINLSPVVAKQPIASEPP